MFIDINYFNANKEYNDKLYDIVIEAVSMKEICKNNITDHCLLTKFASVIKIIPFLQNNKYKNNDDYNNSNVNLTKHMFDSNIFEYKVKVLSQKLLINGGFWYEMHDVYGMNSDYNSR